MSRLPAVLVAGALLTGCTGDTGDDGGTPDDVDAGVTSTVAGPRDDAASTTDAVVTAGPEEAEALDLAGQITDPELLDQVTWILEHLEPEAPGPDVEVMERRLDRTVLEQGNPVQLGLAFAQVRSGGPYTVTQAVTSEGTGRMATLRLDADEPLVLTVSLAADGLINGFYFLPDTSGELPVLEDWADLDAALTELGGTTQVVAAHVEDGRCTPVHTTEGFAEGGEPAPSASVFKLLVLAGVADAVAAGDLAWDVELTITEELKSLPSGVLQDRDAGSTVAVRDAAELMISISDNTATDLLMEAMGQERLAAVAEEAGLDVARVAPVPSTRELFQLGWQVDQDVRDRWAAASGDPDARVEILEGLPAELDVDLQSLAAPRWQDGVDWMLTGMEICGLHAYLQQQAGTEAGGPVRQILSANPGLEPPDGVDHQAFKGGSVAGVLAHSFYVEAGEADGRVLVVQTYSDTDVDQLRAQTIIRAGLEHLADR